jgi:hypothetical protein
MKVKIQVSFINELKWMEDIDFKSAESMAAWIDYRETGDGWGYFPIFHSEADAKQFGFEQMTGGEWALFMPMYTDCGRVCGEYIATMADVEE